MSYNGARPKVKSCTSVKHSTTSESQNLENKHSSEDDSHKFYRDLSVRLCDVLDHIGASSEHRKLRQDCSISQEIISTMIYQASDNILKECYIFGSSSEGTTVPSLNSDQDRLLIKNVPIVENIRKAVDGESLLMIRDAHTKAGYVKLQLVYNGQPLTICTRDIDRFVEEFDSEGRICLKHSSEIEHFSFLHTRNGPADTNIEDNVDYVVGFRCLTIPKFAKEWIGRDRQYEWPTKRMLDKMSTMGCFVVGVGHPTSKEKDIEWRLSFSFQEREMMFSMNAIQHKCYILLKIVKKNLIEPIVGKSISSYHLKTCMFHVIGNTRLRFWKRRNLVQCVLLSMYVLLKWVYIGNCPNYFEMEENMFDRDAHRTQRLNLLHQIRFLLSHGCGFLFLIKLDNVGDFLKNGTENIRVKSGLDHAMYHVKYNVILSAMEFNTRLCYEVKRHCNASHYLYMILKYVYQTKSMKDHTEQQTQKAFSYILPYIHLRLAQTYATLVFNTFNGERKRELLQEFGHHLREGRHCDQTSSILLEATVYLKLENYENCIVILDRLDVVFKKMSLPICGCYRGYIKCESQFHTLSVSGLLGKASPCMKFHWSDMPITPEGLQYEMFRAVNTSSGSRDYKKEFDMAVVDAVVYLHFMQYLANAKLNQRFPKHVAIHKLESVLQSGMILGHRETGYNLLGWIHVQEKWMQRGIKYFQKSLAIRPRHNAAKQHILQIVPTYI